MNKKQFQKEKLQVEIYETPDNLGKAAAANVAALLNRSISEKGFTNLILATGASQFQFLEALQTHDID